MRQRWKNDWLRPGSAFASILGVADRSFAAAALILSIVGLYGVIAYSVRRDVIVGSMTLIEIAQGNSIDSGKFLQLDEVDTTFARFTF